jgi:L-ribulose-5-phosphate 4-epimerase
MLLEALRTEVLRTALLLPKYGLVWMAGGTVCARDPESSLVVVTPSGMPYDTLEPADMLVTDMSMKLIDGKYKPSCALNLWTEIMRRRSDMHAVIHTHSPYATAFSVVDQPIPIVTETQADWFGQSIQVAPYYHVEDPEFVSEPIKALGDGYAVLLGRYGPITIGKNLAHALERAVTLEEAAKIYILSCAIGTPLTFSPEESTRSFDFYHNRYGQKPLKDAQHG